MTHSKKLYISLILFACMGMTSHSHGEPGWPENLSLSGTVEAELGSYTDYNDDTGSGIAVPTVELVLDAAINDNTSAAISFLYQEGSTEFGVDTAFIQYQSNGPLALTMGHIYIPFGVYDTQLVSGSLPSEIGEAQHSVGMVSYQNDGFFTHAYIFNGVEDRPNTDDVLSVYGVAIGYEANGSHIGADFITDLSESTGVIEALRESELTPQDDLAGMSLHGELQFGSMGLILQTVRFLDAFDASVLAYKAQGAKPSAYHAEYYTALNIGAKACVAAGGFSGTSEAVALRLPKQRTNLGLVCELTPGVEGGLEYLVAKDYDENEGGTGKNETVITFLLSARF